jgi:hypothetical protein
MTVSTVIARFAVAVAGPWRGPEQARQFVAVTVPIGFPLGGARVGLAGADGVGIPPAAALRRSTRPSHWSARRVGIPFN